VENKLDELEAAREDRCVEDGRDGEECGFPAVSGGAMVSPSTLASSFPNVAEVSETKGSPHFEQNLAV